MTNFAGRMAKSIAQLREVDVVELRDFQERMYQKNLDITLPTFSLEWLWHANPRASIDEPGIWICRREGRIVGMQAEIPFSVKIDDEEVRAASPIELMVDPEWRLRGVGPALSEVQRHRTELVLALGITEDAIQMYRRLGWTDLGTLDRRLYVAHPMKVLQYQGSTQRRAFLALLAPFIALLSSFTSVLARIHRGGTRLVEQPHFDERVDELWSRVSASYGAIAVRDYRNLHWRFDQCPRADVYRRFYLERRRSIRGYVVLRDSRWRGLKTLKIVDYLATPRDVVSMFAHAIRIAKQSDHVFVEVTSRDEPSRRKLAMTGLARVRARGAFRGRSSGFRCMISVGSGGMAAATATTPWSWFLTSADSDLEFFDLESALEVS